MLIQSNGMGQQSVALYLMSSLGLIERFDYSIFADPGAEKEETYKYLEWLKAWQKKNNGIPIIHDKSKNLYKDLFKQRNSTGHRFSAIPAFTENGAILRRQCTLEYKIRIVNKNIRELQGKRKGQSFDPVKEYFGISIEEMDRMFSPKRKNLTHMYPFCGYEFGRKEIKPTDHKRMSRAEINKWMKDNGFPIPPPSACVFCPFMNNQEWKTLTPKDFSMAKNVDYAIRDMTKQGINNKLYLHRSCKPIDKVDFNKSQYEMNFDCYGYCNV